MRKKCLTVLFAIILFIMLFPLRSFATEVELTTDTNEIKAGDTVTILIKLKNTTSESGINLIQGQLIYDQQLWEQVSTEDIKCKNNWSITYNNEDTESGGKFILINLDSEEVEEQELVEITLKAKSNFVSNETEIKLIDVYTTDGENMIELNSQVQQIKIQANVGDYAVLIGSTLAIVVLFIITIIFIKKKDEEK